MPTPERAIGAGGYYATIGEIQSEECETQLETIKAVAGERARIGSEGGIRLSDPARAELARPAYVHAYRDLPIVRSRLQSSAVGAACLVFDSPGVGRSGNA